MQANRFRAFLGDVVDYALHRLNLKLLGALNLLSEAELVEMYE